MGSAQGSNNLTKFTHHVPINWPTSIKHVEHTIKKELIYFKTKQRIGKKRFCLNLNISHIILSVRIATGKIISLGILMKSAFKGNASEICLFTSNNY